MQYVENHNKQSRLFAPPLEHSLKQALCNLDCSCTVRLLTTVPGTDKYQINLKVPGNYTGIIIASPR